LKIIAKKKAINRRGCMKGRGRGFLYRSLFFVGWLLSPLTFWNDVFVNIPLAYLCASLCYRLAHFDFLQLALIFYWLSNLIGILLMYVYGRLIGKEEGLTLRTLFKTILTVIIYSIVLFMLSELGVLKPAHLPGI